LVGRRRTKDECALGTSDLPRDRVPDYVVERAKAAFGHRAPGVVASVAFNSDVDRPGPVGGAGASP